jgi:2-polyprenyl-3-methyl-5-hydroxy-6-metoxy-1,4-benzoquinol methylase
MRLPLDPARVADFEEQMGAVAPWMHAFRFGDSIYTGYYKYEGVDGNLTYANSRSAPGDLETLRQAYATRDPVAWPAFVNQLFDLVEPDRARRADLRVLDIASATGQLSLRAIDAGFGRVMSSEIRANQVAQQRLILSSLQDARYRDAIEVVHDPLSADDDGYPARYAAFAPDVVCSFGLLYHLANPVQHLINLRDITRGVAVVYTTTHISPFARRAWHLTLENRDWITKATSGVSWTPHFLEVSRLAREIGFRRATVAYPEMFARQFPGYARDSRATDVALLLAKACRMAFGVHWGAERNQRFEYFRHSNLNPNYFAYVLEK